IGTLPRGPCHGDLAIGTLSRGPCHRDLATGTSPWGSCHGDVPFAVGKFSLARSAKGSFLDACLGLFPGRVSTNPATSLLGQTRRRDFPAQLARNPVPPCSKPCHFGVCKKDSGVAGVSTAVAS
ncbi:hypothetical protein M885DRAFT_537131, partial [Pelagophyceae sp. CCMP2097]